MFDLQFYNMIAKCYIIMGYNSMIKVNEISKNIDYNTYRKDIDYVNEYVDYIPNHVSYFSPKYGLRNRTIHSISYK